MNINYSGAKMKKIAIIMVVVIGLSMTPAQAVNIKTIYKDSLIKVQKFCDGRNLVYLTDPRGWRGANPTLFVSPNDSQCKAAKK